MLHGAGGSSIYSGMPIQRIFRDVHAISQHALRLAEGNSS
ncbi:hypothetical protein DMA12_12780 [Amycolatopsis balhimycina DSM 5908]|uniref:Acyl-CoA dehydrogenase C-terminal domain-containing protein n=1 Tax=Amycolatopsis balhimycina DSM 5908 TaxID=1081091 RepID=A0A428WRT5_AMYBA|nr:hypothetical protein DMA12_12780 [Amycolatopsis balhimycina DSM 5908]